MKPRIPTWTLKGITGEFEGNSLELKQPLMTVGRTSQNHIIISDTNISRHHVTFFVETNEIMIEDQGSKNGTLVNEKKIDSGVRIPIQHGDRIEIGPHVFILELEETSANNFQQQQTNEIKDDEIKPDDHNIEPPNYQPTTIFSKPALLGKIKKIKIPKINWNRRTIMYCVLGGFVIVMLLTYAHNPSEKQQTSPSPPSMDVEIQPSKDLPQNTPPLNDAEIESLKTRAKAALQFQDYLAATELYEKIILAAPQDEYAKTQYEFAKRELKLMIENHLEQAKQEYEKLNYERAVIEWKQVLALTSKNSPELYSETMQKIKDAEKEMQKRR